MYYIRLMKWKIILGLLIFLVASIYLYIINRQGFKMFPNQRVLVDHLCEQVKDEYHKQIPQIPIEKIKCVVDATNLYGRKLDDINNFRYDITLKIDVSYLQSLNLKEVNNSSIKN